jgi:hypothetical protein
MVNIFVMHSWLECLSKIRCNKKDKKWRVNLFMSVGPFKQGGKSIMQSTSTMMKTLDNSNTATPYANGVQWSCRLTER